MSITEAWNDDHSGPAPVISVTVDAGWEGFAHLLGKLVGSYVSITTRDGVVVEGIIAEIDFDADDDVRKITLTPESDEPNITGVSAPTGVVIATILSVVYL